MRWRTLVFVGLVACILNMGASWVLYARADQVDNIERRQLVSLILELDTQLCMQLGDDRIRTQIAETIEDYRELTGEPFPLPLRCADD